MKHKDYKCELSNNKPFDADISAYKTSNIQNQSSVLSLKIKNKNSFND